MNINKLIIYLILFIPTISIAQTDIDLSKAYRATLPNQISPSPSSRLFETYVENISEEIINPSGSKTYDFILHKINFDGIEIPIGVSYQTNGIRFWQHNGDVGVGWILNPSYRITRTVQGYPDEEGRKTPDNLMSLVNSYKDQYQKDKFIASFISTMPGPSETSPQPLDRDSYDSGYDLFSYSLPNISGHFLITDNKNKKVDILEKLNHKITYEIVDDQIKVITVIDDKGFMYVFGKTSSEEYINEKNYSRDSQPAITAWALCQIISPKGRRIDFEYINESLSYFKPTNTDTYTLHDYYTLKENSGFGVPHFVSTETNVYPNQSTTFLLTKITSDEEIIEFNRNADTQPINDRFSKHKVNQINIFDNINKEKNIIKYAKYKFESNNYSAYFLTSIDMNGENYKFSYEGQNMTQLNSYIPDQWDFYKKDNSYSSGQVLHKSFISTNQNSDRYLSSDKGDLTPINVNALYNDFSDRISNSDPSLFSLTHIYYPTGGHQIIEYEPHKYKSTMYGDIVGGGIRIKSTKYITGNDTIERKFLYGADDKGFGIATIDINHKMFGDEFFSMVRTTLPTGSDYDLIMVLYLRTSRIYATNILGDISISNNFSVTYPRISITEISPNGENNGKTILYYSKDNRYSTGSLSYSPPRAGSYMTFPGSIHSNHNNPHYITGFSPSKKPVLTNKKIYNSQNMLILHDSIVYNVPLILQDYNGIKVVEKLATNFFREDLQLGGIPSPYHVDVYDFASSFYAYNYFHYYSGIKMPQYRIRTVYDKSKKGYMINRENYNYNDKNQITKTIKEGSYSDNIIRTLMYPQDFASGNNIYQQMVNKNIIAPVIEEITEHNDKEVGRIKTSYIQDSNKTKGLILQNFIETSSGNIARTDATFDLYDTRGNLLQYTTLDGVSTTCLWGYNYQYPIVEIKNATYDEVKNALGKNPEDISSQSEPDMTLIEGLRSKLPNALVTTYTYKPLVGMTSVTDPRGVKTIYEYDDFGRLKGSEDHQGNKIEEYRYHYRNQ